MTEKIDSRICNLIIADDHQLFVDSLKLLLQSSDSRKFHVQAEAYNGDDLLEILKIQRPDLLLLDINLPAKNGLEVLQEVKKNLKTDRKSVV